MTQTVENKSIILKARPVGLPLDEVWGVVNSPVAKLHDGQILISVIYASVDPAMRGWIEDQKSYMPPVGLGETMRALGVGKVIDSRCTEYAIGDYVTGMFGLQNYAVVKPDAMVSKIDVSLAPPATHLGLLGMPGMTAYFGLLEVGEPREGDTLLISGAAGAVGAIVGQIALIKGCRVIGIAGSAKKCDYIVNDLGFHGAINYKEESVSRAVGKFCPNGVDIFFDNVGGELLNEVVANMAYCGRVVICGAIAEYNSEQQGVATVNYLPLLYSSARLEGFVVLNYIERYPEAILEISDWLKAGKVTALEDVREGIDNFPSVFRELFSGNSFGKLLLKL